MTTLQKTSRANAVRQRRSSQNPAGSNAGFQYPTCTRQAGTRQTTRTSRQAYRPDSVFLPVEPRPVAPATHRQMKSGPPLDKPSA